MEMKRPTIDPHVRDCLARRGWARFAGVRSPEDLLSVARRLGEPLAAPSGEMIKILSPVDKSETRRRHSLSAAHGRGPFPFHTDTAFWGMPSRFLVMHVRGDTRRCTLLLDFEHIWSELGTELRQAAQRSVWRTTRGRQIYCSMSIYARGVRGWRYDPYVMKPANRSAEVVERATQAALQHCPQQQVTITWKADLCLIIDNWRMLHARGTMPDGEGHRELLRVYVGDHVFGK